MPSDVANRAKAIYEERIRPLVEKDHFGKVVSIEVNSGDYELSEDNDDYVVAIRRLRARHPDPETFSIRVGYRTLAKMGGFRWCEDKGYRLTVDFVPDGEVRMLPL